MKLAKKDILALCLCAIAMLAAMGALGRGSKQARIIACQSNLRKLSQITDLYRNDNDQQFYTYASSSWDLWLQPASEYVLDFTRILHCPETIKLKDGYGYSWGDSRTPWQWNHYYETGFNGCYVFNGWLYSSDVPYIVSDRTKMITAVTSPARTPVFTEGNWVDAWPQPTDSIPVDYDFKLQQGGSDSPPTNHIRRIVSDRHYGRINVVFADGHTEAVPLSELWSLNWHSKWQPKYEMTRTDGSPIYKANTCK